MNDLDFGIFDQMHDHINNVYIYEYFGQSFIMITHQSSKLFDYFCTSRPKETHF